MKKTLGMKRRRWNLGHPSRPDRSIFYFFHCAILCCMEKALLLSGGMDSTTHAVVDALARGDDVHSISIDYNQRHKVELAVGDRANQSAQYSTQDDFARPEHDRWQSADGWKVDVDVRGVPYEKTHTFYEGRRPACGRCDACAERIASFRDNGVCDQLEYEVDIAW